MRRCIVWVVAAVLAAGCGPGETREPAPAKPRPEPKQAPRDKGKQVPFS